MVFAALTYLKCIAAGDTAIPHSSFLILKKSPKNRPTCAGRFFGKIIRRMYEKTRCQNNNRMRSVLGRCHFFQRHIHFHFLTAADNGQRNCIAGVVLILYSIQFFCGGDLLILNCGDHICRL